MHSSYIMRCLVGLVFFWRLSTFSAATKARTPCTVQANAKGKHACFTTQSRVSVEHLCCSSNTHNLPPPALSLPPPPLSPSNCRTSVLYTWCCTAHSRSSSDKGSRCPNTTQPLWCKARRCLCRHADRCPSRGEQRGHSCGSSKAHEQAQGSARIQGLCSSRHDAVLLVCSCGN